MTADNRDNEDSCESIWCVFVLLYSVVPICNHSCPVPSPWSAAWRPEYSKYENTPWFPKWISRGIALQIDFQGNTALKAAFLGFEAHQVTFNGVSNSGTGEAEGVHSDVVDKVLIEEIASRYKALLETNFAKTGKLWEKYDGNTGQVVNAEYEAPPMLGWTAGIYLAFLT